MEWRSALISLAAATFATSARAADPPVPIGQDPGGTAVAIISTGIDYTIPVIAKSLARDGEGEIIAWDFIDNDNRPFDGDRERFGNLMVELFTKTDLRTIPIRVDVQVPLWLAGGSAFAARTPARVIVLPMPNIPAEIERIKPVAKRFNTLHFVVVPNSDALEATRLATSSLANVGILAEGMCTGYGGARESVEMIGSRLCEPSEAAGTNRFQFQE